MHNELKENVTQVFMIVTNCLNPSVYQFSDPELFRNVFEFCE